MPATMTALEKGRKYLSLLGTNEKGGGGYSFKPVIITSHPDYTVTVYPNKTDASLPPETLIIHNLTLEKIVDETDRAIANMPDAIANECDMSPEGIFATLLFFLTRTERGMVIWKQEGAS